MILLRFQCQLIALTLLCALRTAAAAEECCFEMSRPACGKVCKLVCESKKLTSTCYGCKCKDVCLPGPSRPGCKHCAVCSSKCDGKADDARSCPPKCEFCWRDWFPCGCAEPRTIHVLTKYQAEKKICWYHWEVVDAACCNGGSEDIPSSTDKDAAKHAGRTIYKPAPTDAQVGEILPVSDEEWVKLAAVLSPDPAEIASATATVTTASFEDTTKENEAAYGGAKTPSVAERLQRMLTK